MEIKALTALSYGMYVVSSLKGDKLNGQIANTVFQVTSEPPTVAASINRKNLTWEYIKDSGIFAVSVLSRDTPLSFIGRFGFKSGRDADKLAGVNYRVGSTGAPIVLDNAVAYLELKVIKAVDAGTHTIYIGELVDAGVINESPAMTYQYYHEIKRGTTPGAAPTFVKLPPE